MTKWFFFVPNGTDKGRPIPASDVVAMIVKEKHLTVDQAETLIAATFEPVAMEGGVIQHEYTDE